MTLGSRIQHYRNQKQISGVELARLVGVSRSLISQVENDTANPSIDTLRRIANVLDIPIAMLFEDADKPTGIVIKPGQRKILKVPQSNLTYELLTPDLNWRIEFLWIEIEPGQQDVPSPIFSHEGEENAIILQGQLHLWLNDEKYVLEAGDSISFDSSIPHSIANLGDEKLVLISAITPPSF